VCALATIVAGIVDAAALPVTMFGLAASNYRWLWSLAAFLVIGALMAAVTYRPERMSAAVTVALGSVVAIASVANLPTSHQVPRSDVYLARQEQVAAMTDQLADADFDVDGPVLFDASRLYFGHPFSYPAMVVLQDLDVDFRFDDPINRRRLGDGRAADGTETALLVFWHGDEARNQLVFAENLLVFVDAPDPLAITLEPL
jgi:hypothetical protein